MNDTAPSRVATGRKVAVTVILLLVAALVIYLFWGHSNKPTIVVLGEDSATISAMENLRDEYESSAGVQLEFSKNTLDVSLQKANQDLANGTGLYDILLQYNFSLSAFVLNDWVYKIDDFRELVPNFDSLRAFESDIFPNVWREVAFFRAPSSPAGTESPFGYPFAANSMILVYNRNMFEDTKNRADFNAKYGRPLEVPRDWNTFRQIAEFFTAADGSSHGVVLQGGQGGFLYCEWCNFAYSMGGGVMRKQYGWEGNLNTPIILDSPETIRATEFYVSLKPFSAGDFFSVGSSEQAEMLRTEPIAMGIAWSDFLFQMLQGTAPGQLGFAPIPGETSMIGGGAFFINKKSKHPKEAMEYVLYLLRHENQVEMMKNGLSSPLKSVYEDPQVKTVPYAKALRESLDRAVYMLDAGPDADAISQLVTTAVQRAWRGEIGVEQALSRARKELEQKRIEIFSSLEGNQ